MTPKTTKGRQKIEMKKITDENSLGVAFTKRHAGIFKKASELCTLCGVEIAIITFSPTQKAFSFGHPYVQEIVDRFLNKNPPPCTGTSDLIRHLRNSNIQELNEQLTQLLDLFDAEKEISEEHNKKRKATQNKFLWDAPMENLGVEELQKLKVLMLDLKKNCEKQAEKIMAEVTILTGIVSDSGYTGLGGVGPWM